MNPEPLPPEVRSCRVESAEASLYVQVTGEGPPLLLLHGWTLDHRSFAPQVADLSPALRLIVPDRRGCGQSSGAPDLGAELEDIDRLVDELAGEPVHLLGVSQGGRLALRYAATRSERVRSLILQGAVLDGFTPPDAPGESIPLEHYAGLVSNGQIAQLRAEWLQHPMMSAGASDPALREALRHMVEDYCGDDLRVGAGPLDIDVAKGLSALQAPALIITGEYEVQARKAHAARLLELLPRSEEVIIEGAGHLSNLSHPQRYNALVLDFCQRVTR